MNNKQKTLDTNTKIPMSRRLNQVANWDFSKLTLPQWRSRSEVSYGSLKTPKTAFPDQKIAKTPENPKKSENQFFRICFRIFQYVCCMFGSFLFYGHFLFQKSHVFAEKRTYVILEVPNLSWKHKILYKLIFLVVKWKSCFWSKKVEFDL